LVNLKGWNAVYLQWRKNDRNLFCTVPKAEQEIIKSPGNKKEGIHPFPEEGKETGIYLHLARCA
jgi:hypothetical protein